MIIVQDCFVCKPGNASKLAKKFKAAMEGQKELLYILTDMTGQYNRVIMLSQFENLTAYDQSWEEMMKDTEAMKKMEAAMEGYHDMYLTGEREIFRTW